MTTQPPIIRALGIPELRNELLLHTGSFSEVWRSVSKLYAERVLLGLNSLSSPLLLLSRFFPRPIDCVSLLKETGSLLSGICVRRFMHAFDPSGDWADLIVSPATAALVLLHLGHQGYKLAASAGDVAQYERERRWLADDCFLFVGGPGGRQKLNVIVCMDDPLTYVLKCPLIQNMQAFDGWCFFDLYPIFGVDGPNGLNDMVVQGLDLLDIRKFVPPKARLGNIIPPNRAITSVHRVLGDAQCLILPNNYLPPRLSRNSWEVQLHVEILRDDPRSWVVFDADVVNNAALSQPYTATRDLAHYANKALHYAQSQVTMGTLRAPRSWDTELDTIFESFCCNVAYARSRLPKPGPFYYVSYTMCR